MSEVHIVGGGVMGLGIAWRLARAGVRSTVYDAGEPGRGASWAAAGMLAPHAELQPEEEAQHRLGLRSQALWTSFSDELQADSGVDLLLDRTGTLLVAADRDEAEALERDLCWRDEAGVPYTRISAADARDLEPLLSPRIASAAHCPHDIQVSNRALLKALIQACDHSLITVRSHCAVDAIESADGLTLNLSNGESITAERVVLCAGAWSKALSPSGARAPIRPVKGQMLSLRTPGVTIRHVIRGFEAYLIPKSDGTLVVGATSEDVGFDANVTGGGVYELLKAAGELLPAIWEYPLAHTWAGFRPASRDNGPLLGETEIRGLFYCTGHYRHGIQQAPVSVLSVTAELLGGEPVDEALPFTPTRFGASAQPATTR